MNNADRDREIFSARCSGKTFKQIGIEYGISAERVRGIVCSLERKAFSYDRMKNRMAQEIAELESIVKKYRLADREGQSIDDFGFSVRTHNALTAYGIKTVEQVKAMSRSDILSIPNLGRKSFNELAETLMIPKR